MDTLFQLNSQAHASAWHCGPAIVEDVPWMQAACRKGRRAEDVHPFAIHLAVTDAGRCTAHSLVNRLYRQRGYGAVPVPEAHPRRVTLAATAAERLLGTVTLTADTADGLLADAVFKPEIDAFRQRGARVCEVTKLGIDPGSHSRMALASLFHIVYLYAHKVYDCTDVFIEVNPRHRRFYESMLGFQSEAEVRINPRVNAQAHLLRASLDTMAAQIAKLGGSERFDAQGRSLYPHFFGSHQANHIEQRLRRWTDGPDVQQCEQ